MLSCFNYVQLTEKLLIHAKKLQISVSLLQLIAVYSLIHQVSLWITFFVIFSAINERSPKLTQHASIKQAHYYGVMIM